MKKIFIIEDNMTVREEITKYLEAFNYECITSNDFEDIVNIALNAYVDLILLDINLPYFDGFEICKAIRKNSTVPIIMLTSRDTELDEIISMNLGADNFISKPFNPQILLSHINAILKRTQNIDQVIEYQGVKVLINKSLIIFEEYELELTKNELKILLMLFQFQGSIVSREDLMNELWQSDVFVDDNTLTVNVNRLRKKLSSIGLGELIATKRGQGYLI